ncbi:MAG: helix-turn-helix domain-containing protein [Spirochaetes bacterium]|nr:helix-turn-helix domain-containing protein [Spirochaetota bacterium]
MPSRTAPPSLHVSTVRKFSGYKCERFSRGAFGLHTHAHLEIMAVVSGSGWHWVNEKRFPLRPGEIWLLGPCQSHRAVYDAKKSGRHYNLGFPVELLLGSKRPRAEAFRVLAPWLAPGIPAPVLLPKAAWSRALALFAWLVAEEERGDPWREGLADGLIQALVHLISRHAPQPLKAPDSAVLATLARIGEHFQEPLTTTALAAAESLSPARLAQRFLRATGLSVKEALNDRRLREARRLLSGTDLEITRVGGEAGFMDPSYFNRVFRKAFQMTPSEWRRRQEGAPGGGS